MRAPSSLQMGRMDIDYQVLHDAFFKFQTRPKLTIVGDLYYEGKVRPSRYKNAESSTQAYNSAARKLKTSWK